MGKLRSDQKGLSAVEIILVLVIVGLISVVGFMVYKNYKKTNDATTASTASSSNTTQTKNVSASDPYAGWKTYSSTNNLGLGFKYPASWMVTENNPRDMCAGQSTVGVALPANEVEAAFKQIGASYTAPSTQNNGATLGSYYDISVTKAGQSLPSKCGSDNGSTGVYNWSGISETYLMSTEEIQAGALKGNWFTFYGPTDGHTKSNPDTMILSANNYGTSSPKFTDSAIITIKDAQYQVIPQMGEKFGQYSVNTTVNPATFKSTDLYKKTLLLLNSVQ